MEGPRLESTGNPDLPLCRCRSNSLDRKTTWRCMDAFLICLFLLCLLVVGPFFLQVFEVINFVGEHTWAAELLPCQAGWRYGPKPLMRACSELAIVCYWSCATSWEFQGLTQWSLMCRGRAMLRRCTSRAGAIRREPNTMCHPDGDDLQPNNSKRNLIGMASNLIASPPTH